MDAAGHQEVPRPLRRRRRQDRGLEFEEAALLHPAAHRIDNAAAGHDVLVQPLATQVEEAVLQPDVFRIILVPGHGQRQRAGRSQHLDLRDENLDFAGGQLGIDRPLRALAHLAVDTDHPLRAQRLGQLEGRRIGVDDALGQAVMVPQVDKQQTAMVADDVAPAREPNRLADVAGAKRAAGVGPIAVHGHPNKAVESVNLPGFERPGLPEAGLRGNQMQRILSGLSCSRKREKTRKNNAVNFRNRGDKREKNGYAASS